MKHRSIIFSTLPWVMLMVFLKWASIYTPKFNEIHIMDLVEISDVGIVFTGAFFVMGLMLAGTMTDFKESEKIPGEIACNLEAIEDNLLLALRTHKPTEVNGVKTSLNQQKMVEALTELTDKIQGWFKSETKDSKEIFPALRKMNEIAFYMANNGADKDAVKGVQENVNGLRKQLTRAYTISRTDFIKPAYILLKSLLFSVLVLLLICKFKTLTGAVLVTGFISFIFIYLYLLINGLDDPFELNREDTEVDLLPLDRFRSRLEASFQVHLNKQEG